MPLWPSGFMKSKCPQLSNLESVISLNPSGEITFSQFDNYGH